MTLSGLHNALAGASTLHTVEAIRQFVDILNKHSHRQLLTGEHPSKKHKHKSSSTLFSLSQLANLKNIFKTRYQVPEKVSEEWKVAIITSIHKKGHKRKCENYRGILGANRFSRIYGHIVAKLVESEYKNMEMEEQSGFRAGRSCIDNIFCITQMIEKKQATNRELHLLFIDLTKA